MIIVLVPEAMRRGRMATAQCLEARMASELARANGLSVEQLAELGSIDFTYAEMGQLNPELIRALGLESEVEYAIAVSKSGNSIIIARGGAASVEVPQGYDFVAHSHTGPGAEPIPTLNSLRKDVLWMTPGVPELVIGPEGSVLVVVQADGTISIVPSP